MLALGDIGNILVQRVKSNAILGAIPEIRKNRHEPVTEGNVHERIVIVIPGGSKNGQFQRCYPRICIYVPYRTVKKGNKTKYYAPDEERLRELENVCIGMFRSSTYGVHGTETFLYGEDVTVVEDDPETWSNFLNVRLKFEVINTKL
ncbi:MAG: hypothetical protein LBB90_10435 [Tannerella sp.]|jgi:hypothetical protein|nr:hypothetical protein [Tannerella sp.]